MLPRACFTIALLLLPASGAAAQERVWSLDASGEDVYMIFGVPETDDVGISFWCPVQNGEINVFQPLPGQQLTDGEMLPMTLVAGDVKLALNGTVDANAESGSPSVEAKLAADAPFLKALAEADRFHLKVKDITNVYPMTDADVGQLLDLCRMP